MYDKLYNDYDQLFTSHTKYGALTEEQKRVKMRMLKQHFEKIKRLNYKWCNERDEWEEEVLMIK